MEFFDRKEEVIDIQLTQYGKHLLSKGRFKPKFYAFYDDDVIYDTAYAGFGEVQTESEGRMTTTPRIKPQSAYEGAETRIKRITKTEATKNLSNDEKASILQQVTPTPTRVYGLSDSLGTSDYNSHKAPAWSVMLLEGEIDGSIPSYTTGSIKITRIPQLSVISETNVSVAMDGESTPGPSFSDGSSYNVSSDTVILDIEEVNSANRKMNFDVEVYEVETDENGNEELRLLKFPNFADPMSPGLSIETDGDVAGNMISENAENQDYIHYYINLHVDEEIQRPTAPSGLVSSPLTLPENDFDCEDDVGSTEGE